MIKISIECEKHEIDDHMAALGFYRTSGVREPFAAERRVKDEPLIGLASGGQTVQEKQLAAQQGLTDSGIPGSAAAQEPASAKETIEPRKPGEPSGGRKRRTKEEMAEDEAYFAAYPKEAQTKADAPLISTGEERVDPAVAAQDAADEAAETAAAADGKLTHDTIRNAVARYAHAHSLEKAIADIRGIIGCAIADVPDTQEAIAAAVAKIDAAVAVTPNIAVKEVAEDSLFFDSPPLAVEQPKPARKEDVGLAISAYGIEYDGEGTTAANMPITCEDLPRVLAKEFGADITKVKQISTPEQYGRAVVAIRRALQQNPFNRPSKRKA